MEKLEIKNLIKHFVTNEWSKIPYKESYAISNIFDVFLKKFTKKIKNFNRGLTSYIVYNNSKKNNNNITIFDNGTGLKYKWFEEIKKYKWINVDEYHKFFSALYWWGNKIKIESQHINQEGLNVGIINFENIIENDFLNINNFLDKKYESKTKYKHGTLLKIVSLKKNITEYEWKKIGKEISFIYQKYINAKILKIHWIYIKDNDILSYNGEKLFKIKNFSESVTLLSPTTPELYKLPNINKTKILIDKKIDIDEKKKIRIKGFAGVLKNFNYEQSGLHIFSKNKLIMGAARYSAYKPINIFGQINDLENDKIYGEIEIEGIKTSISGNQFCWDENIKLLIDKTLINALGKQGDIKEEKKLTNILNTSIQKTHSTLGELLEEFDIKNETNIITNSLKQTKAIVNVEIEASRINKKISNLYHIKDEYGQFFHIQLINATNKETNGQWIQKKYKNEKILIYFNVEHPFFKSLIKFKNFYTSFTEFIIYYIMAEEKAINEGSSVEELKMIINTYLKKNK